MDDAGEFSADPFREEPTAISKGIVHRFQDRVLLAATNNCAMYCRHCTRKNTLGEMCPQENSGFETALQYIAEHPQVREVLISGGDPLLLNTEVLDRLLGRIHSIKHIEVVRIGTRVPVVLPMRVDSELSAMLAGHKPLWINTQFNHPRELTKEALTACRRLTDAGIPVSNQSVLLKGVNDDFETMHALCAKLQRNLIRPYYLFQCDPIAGIPHFRTDISAGVELEKRLRESIGGLALPRFVADLPGEKSKTAVTIEFL
jgi:lysine 2,3-aminomutase